MSKRESRFRELGKGSIKYDRRLLAKFKRGELEDVVVLIQSAAQSLMDGVNEKGRTALLSYGHPSAVEVDLQKLKALGYDGVKQELKKLVDIQRQTTAPVEDEAIRVKKLLGH